MLPVYTLTVFLSAALLFFVQPMVAKMVLPLLGGSPAVWNTSMVFFQAVLLAGYLYAHLLTRRFALSRQFLIHGAVLILPLVVALALGRLPVLDPRTLPAPGGSQPSLWLLGALALAVGGPFFVLSTTGPLMQRWFAGTAHRNAADPYFLYAAGNIGSMLALVGYPLLIERLLPLQEQRVWFSAGYAVFAVLGLGCGALALRPRPVHAITRQQRRRGKAEVTQAETAALPVSITWPMRLRWLAFAAVPSSFLLSVTQHVSSDIAAMPLLWVIPLALYLATFVLAFGGRKIPVRGLSVAYFVFAAGLAVMSLARIRSPFWAVAGADMLTFFVGALVCHSRLVSERPDASRLTEFYLFVALGGVIGGSFNALLAPMIFNGIAEYPIAIVAVCLLAAPSFGDRPAGARAPVVFDLLVPLATLFTAAGLLFAFRQSVPAGGWAAVVAVGIAAGLLALRCAVRGPLPSRAADVLVPAIIALGGIAAYRIIRGAGIANGDARSILILYGPIGVLLILSLATRLRIALAIAAVMALVYFRTGATGRQVFASRTFFGVHRITEDSRGRWRMLTHGTTPHGIQAIDPLDAMRPTMYYHPTGPIGQIFRSRQYDPQFDRIAIIGLGAGGLAAYGQPHQTFTFYEIDPEVVRIARDSGYFTFLKRTPAKVDTVVGDGRLEIAKAPARGYDLIIVDAFSSDAIPIHLMTKEAVQIYFDKLADGGVIAFNVSNRYLELRPPLGAIATDLGCAAIHWEDINISDVERARGKLATTWVALARRREDFRVVINGGGWSLLAVPPDTPRWTDDYSNILSTLIRD